MSNQPDFNIHPEKYRNIIPNNEIKSVIKRKGSPYDNHCKTKHASPKPKTFIKTDQKVQVVPDQNRSYRKTSNQASLRS